MNQEKDYREVYQNHIDATLHELLILRDRQDTLVQMLGKNLAELEAQEENIKLTQYAIERKKTISFILFLLGSFSIFPVIYFQGLQSIFPYNYLSNIIPIFAFLMFYLLIFKQSKQSYSLSSLYVSLQQQHAQAKESLSSLNSMINIMVRQSDSLIVVKFD